MKDDRIFINRDPEIFRMVIQYLRTGIHPIDLDKKTQTYYDRELIFLGLKKERSQVFEDLMAIFESKPEHFSDETQKIWDELGPMDFEKLVDDGIFQIDDKYEVKELKNLTTQNGFVYDYFG